jgi:hypothetical protein
LGGVFLKSNFVWRPLVNVPSEVVKEELTQGHLLPSILSSVR